MKSAAKWIAGALLLLLALGLGFVWSLPNGPHSAADVRLLTSLLNEIAAVDVPHNQFIDEDQRSTHGALLERVESGTELSVEDSRIYRQLIQDTLFQHQSSLVWLDANLSLVSDVGMSDVNNIGGKGIVGRHDHHDLSARLNFSDLSDSLNRIDATSGVLAPIVRIANANRAYKNLTDLILHLAVGAHSVSVKYQPPDTTPDPDTMAMDFEAMIVAYKIAQFAPVNSQVYVAQIGRAMDAYDRIVLAVQARINQRLSPVERRLAGRWLSIHTIAPQPDRTMQVRFPR